VSRAYLRGASLRLAFVGEPPVHPIAVVLPRLVCCYCTPHHVMREGPEPTSHGACPIGVARFEAGATA
jgi:hypothetical protein